MPANSKSRQFATAITASQQKTVTGTQSNQVPDGTARSTTRYFYNGAGDFILVTL